MFSYSYASFAPLGVLRAARANCKRYIFQMKTYRWFEVSHLMLPDFIIFNNCLYGALHECAYKHCLPMVEISDYIVILYYAISDIDHFFWFTSLLCEFFIDHLNAIVKVDLSPLRLKVVEDPIPCCPVHHCVMLFVSLKVFLVEGLHIFYCQNYV